MGIFSKPEVIILKEFSDAQKYLEKLEELLSKTDGELQKKIQKEIAITKAGIIGEQNVLFELRNSNMDMVVLQDIYLETEDGLGAQIDFIVITSKYTYLIECKNLFGNIEIDSKGNFIRTMEYGGRKHKERIYSPITQNERHLEVLKEVRAEGKNFLVGAAMRGTFKLFYKSLVVLANPKTVVNDKYAKKEIKNQVLRADQIINVIKKFNSESKEISSSKKDMISLAEGLMGKNIEERKDYTKKFQEMLNHNKAEQLNNSVECELVKESISLENESKDKMICPSCGSDLILRTAKKGMNVGQQFYGCTNYPRCRFILNLCNKEQ